MHKFPKEPCLKRQRVKFVQVKRANFVEPSKHSVVKAVIFHDCFEKNYMVEMGLKRVADPGAVPTVQAPEKQILPK